jgi:nucleoside-diphosphate-sugar epimerase
MKTILLTGGSGFLGKSILNSYLKNDYELLAPTHQEMDLLDFNMTADYIFDACPDVIIHAATVGNTSDALFKNTMMYQNIVRFASMCGKIINISSGAIYDVTKDMDNIKETNLGLSVPTDPYGYGKYLNALQSVYNRNIVELIPFGIIGEYELTTRFVKNNIHRILRGVPPHINAERRMSYIDIQDFIKVIELFVKTDRMDVLQHYNITDGKGIWLSDLLNVVLAAVGMSPMYSILDVKKAPSYTGSNRRLCELFPDATFTPIKETVQRMVDYCAKEAS